jgi:hypothetical protein
MKKTSIPKSSPKETKDMKPEYDFDYSKSRPNRFAGRIDKERVVVVLDPEVAEVFTTPESVNSVLRALVTALPDRQKTKPGHR